MDVLPGGHLTKELEFENTSSAGKFHEEVCQKAVAEVACGREIVFPKEHAGQVPGLRVSPAGVVEERENLIRIIHDKNYSRHDVRTQGWVRGRVGECDDRLGRDPRVCSRGRDARGFSESSRFKGKVRRPSADSHSKQ